ncbi:Uncharacterised protein [Bordetella pertussis]|nr:Uncharacterised protein [Bordetella pertussis]
MASTSSRSPSGVPSSGSDSMSREISFRADL